MKKKNEKHPLELLERSWGNTMIGQTDNGNWTTKLGESLVIDVLQHMGKNPYKIKKKDRKKIQQYKSIFTK